VSLNGDLVPKKRKSPLIEHCLLRQAGYGGNLQEKNGYEYIETDEANYIA